MKKLYLSFVLALGLSLQAHADNWMSRLPDNLYVSQVSLPGAHDAATGSGMQTSLGELTSRTQDIDMAQQWSIGIRAFDLRPQVDGDTTLWANHGIMKTNMSFAETLYLLRDSLIANPSEFVVVHLLYADGFADDKDTYRTLLYQLLKSDDLKDYLINFRRDLTVGDMRGKILLLSRDQYDTKPIGGFLKNWCGYIDWSQQTKGTITNGGTGILATSPLYIQDLSDTHADGQLEAKVEAIETMLDFSTTHETKTTYNITWIFNFASGYTTSISTMNGYRENAAATSAAFIDYLKEHNGPTGIVLADFVGVDESNGYTTRGQELVDTLIANNYKYLERRNQEKKAEAYDQLATVRDSLAKALALVADSCPDVAADYSEDFDGVETGISDKQAEVDSLCAGWLLTDGYSTGYTTMMINIGKIVKEALAAQAEAEGTVGIDAVAADESAVPVRFFSITGKELEAPQRGTVNIVEYSDGTIRKKIY